MYKFLFTESIESILLLRNRKTWSTIHLFYILRLLSNFLAKIYRLIKHNTEIKMR